MAKILDLPDEMLLEIFNKLPMKSYKSVEQVCTRFYDVVNDYSLYTILEFGLNYETEEIIRIFRTYDQYIRKITLFNRKDVNLLLEEMMKMNKLSYIKLKHCFGSDASKGFFRVGAVLLKNVIKSCEKLTGLEIIGTIMDDVWQVLEEISKREMKIFCMKQSIIERGTSTALEPFNIPRFPSYVNEICKKSKETLEKLKIDIYGQEGDVLSLQDISNCRYLKVLGLELHFITWTDQQFHHFYNLNQLTSLSLQFAKTSVSNFVQMFTKPSARNYRKIHLEFCENARNEVLQAIVDNCPNLENLSMSSLTNRTLNPDIIMSLIVNCSKLNRIILAPLNSNSSSILKNFPQQLKNLNYFEIELVRNRDSLTSVQDIQTRLVNNLRKKLTNFDVFYIDYRFKIVITFIRKTDDVKIIYPMY